MLLSPLVGRAGVRFICNLIDSAFRLSQSTAFKSIDGDAVLSVCRRGSGPGRSSGRSSVMGRTTISLQGSRGGVKLVEWNRSSLPLILTIPGSSGEVSQDAT